MPRTLRNGRARAVATVATPIRCAIYTRKSTDAGLDRDFNSLDNQRERAEAYIESQRDEGWVALPERFDDGGVSGGTLQRPALERLLERVREGAVDCVVAYKMDRLVRSMRFGYKIFEVLEDHGVAFVSVTESFNSQTPGGRMFMNLLMSSGQYEREMAAERTRDKNHAARRHGKWTGGMPPLGFDLAPEGGRLVINPDEAEQVKAIFNLYVELSSLMKAVEELTRRGWRKKSWTTRDGKSREGGPWDRVSLRRLLTDPLVIGKQKLGDAVFDGEHQGIVPKVLFQKVQDLLEDNRSNGGASHRNRHGALLRSILRCPACDAAMVHAPTKKGGRLYRYYRCTNAMRKGAGACPTKSIAADKIEALVVDQIRRTGTDPDLQRETFRRVLAEVAAERRGAKAEARRLAKQIATAEATVAKLVHTLTDSQGDARSAVSNEVEKVQEHLRSLEARLVEVRTHETALAAQDIDEAGVARALQEFDAIWEVLLTPERERVLGLLIERVTYDRATEELRIDLSPAGIATLGRELDGEAK